MYISTQSWEQSISLRHTHTHIISLHTLLTNRKDVVHLLCLSVCHCICVQCCMLVCVCMGGGRIYCSNFIRLNYHSFWRSILIVWLCIDMYNVVLIIEKLKMNLDTITQLVISILFWKLYTTVFYTERALTHTMLKLNIDENSQTVHFISIDSSTVCRWWIVTSGGQPNLR